MNQKLLKQCCDKFLIKNKYYEKFPEKIEELTETFSNIIQTNLNNFWETDIWTYNMFHDQSNVFQSNVVYNFLDSVTTQNDIINNDEIEVLNESFLLTSSIMVGIIISLNSLTLASLNTSALDFLKHSTSLVYFNLILKPFEWIGKNLVKFSQPKILKYNIILESTNECYRKCGIDPKKIPALYNEIKDSDIRTNINLKFSKYAKQKTEMGICLRECYLINLSDLIILTAETYLECLKNSKKADDILNNLKLDDSTPLSSVLATLKVSGACVDIYSTLESQISNFSKIVDMLYDLDDTKQDKITHMKELNSRLFKVFSSSKTSNNVNQFKQFPPNYNKPRIFK